LVFSIGNLIDILFLVVILREGETGNPFL